jgi:ketopantoate reductase
MRVKRSASNGLRVEGDRGETVLRPVAATGDPAAIGPVDLVLFCVKLWDVERAGKLIRPLIGSETTAIPLQNGIDASERTTYDLAVMWTTWCCRELRSAPSRADVWTRDHRVVQVKPLF